jgi:hypothetical protein
MKVQSPIKFSNDSEQIYTGVMFALAAIAGIVFYFLGGK